MRLKSAVRHVVGGGELARICEPGPQRRGAYRVDVAVKASVTWPHPQDPNSPQETLGVIANLSGSGAQIRLRHMPPGDSVLLSINPPDAFVEDRARCQLSRPGGPALFPMLGSSGFRQIGESVAASLRSVEARIVCAKAHAIGSAAPIFTLSLFSIHTMAVTRLVRYLERLSLRSPNLRPTPRILALRPGMA
jgi:hypothetical protein